MRIAWTEFLASKKSDATGFELYRRLCDNRSDDSKATDTVDGSMQEHGVKITQGELRELGGLPGISVDADSPDSEMIHLDGRIGLDLLSQGRRPPSVLARFLADEEFPSLCDVSLAENDAEIQDFIGRSAMMELVSRTNQIKQSTDWLPKNLNSEDYDKLRQEPTYMSVVPGWTTNKAAKQKTSRWPLMSAMHEYLMILSFSDIAPTFPLLKMSEGLTFQYFSH